MTYPVTLLSVQFKPCLQCTKSCLCFVVHSGTENVVTDRRTERQMDRQTDRMTDQILYSHSDGISLRMCAEGIKTPTMGLLTINICTMTSSKIKEIPACT